MIRHLVRGLAGVVIAIAAAGGAGAASTPSISYVPEPIGSGAPYLVDAKSAQRARVVTSSGFSDASVSGPSSARILTLRTPFTYETYKDIDACGFQPLQRRDVLQLLFRRVEGSAGDGRSAVVELGSYTNLEGCEVGKVTPFGSLADPGMPMRHLAMSLREPMDDLVPGRLLAGMAEDPSTGGVDIVKFLSGSRIRFATTGTIAGTSMTSDQWLLLALPGEQRGYTRISRDPVTGAETWLQATFSAGTPVSVTASLMVEPEAGASFGTVVQASRMWESGLFVGSPSPFSIYLYQDGNGQRVSWISDLDMETRVDISWRFDGQNILQQRPLYEDVTATRTWQPIANHGSYRFVLESEVANYPEGPGLYIPARVNFYIDRGRATPPPQAGLSRPLRAVPAQSAERRSAHLDTSTRE